LKSCKKKGVLSRQRSFVFSAFDKSEIRKIFEPFDRSHWPKGGQTVNTLIYDSVISDVKNEELMNAFIATHQAFIPSQDLLRRLVGCYYIAAAKEEKQRKKVQSRVLRALTIWIETCIPDFEDPIVEMLIHFIRKDVSQEYPDTSEDILFVIANQVKNGILKLEPVKQLVNTDALRAEQITKLLLKNNAGNIAKQLTIIDSDLFCSVKTVNLLHCAWDKKQLAHRSLPVVRCLQRLDAVSHWCATMILSFNSVPGRAAMIRKFIAICEELRKINNFHSLASLIVAMDIVSVARLQQSFEMLGKKHLKSLEEMKVLFNPTSSFKNYRQMLASASVPIIPYFGVTLSDLTFIDEGNADTFDNGLINFTKQSMIHSSIRDIRNFQKNKHNFEKMEPLYSSLLGISYFDSESLYDLSRIQEPRIQKPTFSEATF